MSSTKESMEVGGGLLNYRAMGRRIRDMRKGKRWTQEAAAEHMDISTSYYGHIERGTRKMSLEMLYRICRLFCVDAQYLLTGMHGGGEDTQEDRRKVIACFLKEALRGLE